MKEKGIKDLESHINVNSIIVQRILSAGVLETSSFGASLLLDPGERTMNGFLPIN